LGSNLKRIENMPQAAIKEKRDPILYVDNNNNNKHELDEPILIMSADNYRRIFNKRPPLSRMLRRQINNTEYIALNENELSLLDTNIDKVINKQDYEGLKQVDFVIEHVRQLDSGYWATEFLSVDTGQSKEVQLTEHHPVLKSSTANKTIKSTKKFIRWLGL